MKHKDNVVELKKLRLQSIQVGLIGTSPLIMHRWSTKAREEMLHKQMKKAKTAKMAKDPQRDFEESIYTDAQGAPAFPSVAFKSAAVDAAAAMDLVKTNLRQSFHIEGDLVPILGDEPTPREDMVRIGMGTADIRHRAQFTKWGTVLSITLNVDMLSIEQLIALFDAAGFGIGVGEWRPQRDGQFGRFKVASEAQTKSLLGMLAKRATALRAVS